MIEVCKWTLTNCKILTNKHIYSIFESLLNKVNMKMLPRKHEYFLHVLYYVSITLNVTI